MSSERKIIKDCFTNLYAYVEMSENDLTLCEVIGRKQFSTLQQAIDYAESLGNHSQPVKVDVGQLVITSNRKQRS